MSNKSIKLILSIKKSGVLTFLTKVRLHSRSSNCMSKDNWYACNPESQCKHVPQKVWCSANLSSLTSDISSCSKLVRKSIARVLTVISQTQRENLRKFYKTKKFKPLDLRPKKTRAMRRALTKHEASLKTKKQQKKLTHFSLRKYAVKE